MYESDNPLEREAVQKLRLIPPPSREAVLPEPKYIPMTEPKEIKILPPCVTSIVVKRPRIIYQIEAYKKKEEDYFPTNKLDVSQHFRFPSDTRKLVFVSKKSSRLSSLPRISKRHE